MVGASRARCSAWDVRWTVVCTGFDCRQRQVNSVWHCVWTGCGECGTVLLYSARGHDVQADSHVLLCAGESVSELMIEKNNYNKLNIVLFYLGVFTFCRCSILSWIHVLLLVLNCLLCNCCWLAVCIVVVDFCVLLSSYVYLLYCVCVVFFFCTLDAGLLARSQYSEGPATGHLDTSFSWFPCVYK